MNKHTGKMQDMQETAGERHEHARKGMRLA